MPEPGLSLFGFLDQADAVAYLTNNCALKPSETAIAVWNGARTALGSALANAGNPELKEIPPGHEKQLRRVMKGPRFTDAVGTHHWEWKLVELDPLLAFQYHVYEDHAKELCTTFTGPTTLMSKQIDVALPHKVDDVPLRVFVQENSIVLDAGTLNFGITAKGGLGPPGKLEAAGVVVSLRSPVLQVVRFDGKCYLKNGYHRAVGARLAGLTHLPCVYIESTNYDDTGANEAGFFQRTLLESANPPTIGHFGAGRVTTVDLLRVRRMITVSWAEYVVPEPK